jgi:hypothetical protein
MAEVVLTDAIAEHLLRRDETLRPGDRQRPKEQRVDDAEDRCRRTDAERQREERRDGEGWRSDQAAQRKPGVLEQVVQHGCPHVPHPPGGRGKDGTGGIPANSRLIRWCGRPMPDRGVPGTDECGSTHIARIAKIAKILKCTGGVRTTSFPQSAI